MSGDQSAWTFYWTDGWQEVVCVSPHGTETLYPGSWLPSHSKQGNPFFVPPDARATAEAMWSQRQGARS